MFFLLLSHDHNTYHRRFRDTWRKWAKEVTRPFAFQPKAPETAKNQYKSQLLIRSHPRGRGFESLQVHHKVRRNFDRITVDFFYARKPLEIKTFAVFEHKRTPLQSNSAAGFCVF